MSDTPTFKYPKAPKLELERVKKRSSKHWEAAGKRSALLLANFAREHVPAYGAFLSSHGINAPVRTIKDFSTLPLLTKDSYLRAYPYADLFLPTGLRAATTISATSGSTGEPFFFPRGPEHDRFYERSMEVLLSGQWDVGKRSTLMLIGFGLGIWIGGIFTYKNFNRLSERHLPMTLIPVGAQKDLYLTSFKKFAPFYDQIILGGYPPFIKDVLDEGAANGIDWKQHRLRILTAAEGYSERFRNHLAEVSGADPVRDMVNIYGTVEQGTIAHETALGNMIRRIAFERPDVFSTLFPDAQNIPTLAQYYPDHVYFEAVEGQLVATGYGSSIPLVRYAFNDLGGVISYDSMRKKLVSCGIDLDAETVKYGISDTLLPLPFVYIHARADLAIIFRGANIYPEEIRNALDSKVFESTLTGRFVARKVEAETLDPVVEINIELQKGVEWSEHLNQKITEAVVEELLAHNSEYSYLYAREPKEKMMPRIVGVPYGDPAYFDRLGKQRWVKK